MKVIVFNAPPGAGKDCAVDILVRKKGVIQFSFKNRLKQITLAIYGISESLWDSWYTREGKELPRTELGMLSCRDALIKVSEDVIKPVYGDDFFGWAEANSLSRIVGSGDSSYKEAAACTDGGFDEEVDPLVDKFGEENVFIVTIHREGHTFEGDSRDWINTRSVPDENYISIVNNGTLEEFYTNVLDTYNYIVNK